jgi:hypothetical protein
LSTDWPDDDREQVKRARDAAEALFKPRPQVARAETPLAAPSAPSSSEQLAPRTPRVIAIPAMTPLRDQKVETPAMAEPIMAEPAMAGRKPRSVTTKRRAPKIPVSEFARIRTLAEYGMTLEQLAENYGVSVREIESIVGTAVDGGGSPALAAE